jgi:type IV pilus assembly protein PilM
MPVLRTLQTFLPPPYYLHLPSVGVDVSDSSLKYVGFRPSARHPGTRTLTTYGDITIEPGTLTRGDVMKPELLAAALREVKQRTNTDYVRLSLPEERAYLFETEVKKDAAHGEIRGLLEFRLEENVPLSPRDAYFDYEIYELPGKGDTLGVSVTAYARETVDGYYRACLDAGVTPLSFEVEAQAIARAVIGPDEQHGTRLIIDFGKTRTGIGIVHNGVLMYTSTIDIGGKELSAAMKKQLGDRPEAELTKLKNEIGLSRDKDHEIHDAIIATVSAVRDELATRIQYWNTRGVGGADRFVEEVILCGGSSNLNGLPEYLATALHIETRRANVWQNAFDSTAVTPPIDRAHAYGYATAIGLALGSIM